MSVKGQRGSFEKLAVKSWDYYLGMEDGKRKALQEMNESKKR